MPARLACKGGAAAVKAPESPKSSQGGEKSMPFIFFCGLDLLYSSSIYFTRALQSVLGEISGAGYLLL